MDVTSLLPAHLVLSHLPLTYLSLFTYPSLPPSQVTFPKIKALLLELDGLGALTVVVKPKNGTRPETLVVGRWVK